MKMKIMILLPIFFMSLAHGNNDERHVNDLYKRVKNYWKKNPGTWARSLSNKSKESSIKARNKCTYYLKELLYEPNFKQLYSMLKKDGIPKSIFNVESCAKKEFKSCMDDKNYLDLVKELRNNNTAYFNPKERYKHLHTKTIYKYYDKMANCREEFAKSVYKFFK